MASVRSGGSARLSRSGGNLAPRPEGPINVTCGSLIAAVVVIAIAYVGTLWWRSAGPFKPPAQQQPPTVATLGEPLSQYRFTRVELQWIAGSNLPGDEQPRFYHYDFSPAQATGTAKQQLLVDSIADSARGRMQVVSKPNYRPDPEQRRFTSDKTATIQAQMREGRVAFLPLPNGQPTVEEYLPKKGKAPYAGPLVVTIHTRDAGTTSEEEEFWISWHADTFFRHPADRRYWLLVPVYKGSTLVYRCRRADLQPNLAHTLDKVTETIIKEYRSANYPLKIVPPDD